MASPINRGPQVPQDSNIGKTEKRKSQEGTQAEKSVQELRKQLNIPMQPGKQLQGKVKAGPKLPEPIKEVIREGSTRADTLPPAPYVKPDLPPRRRDVKAPPVPPPRQARMAGIGTDELAEKLKRQKLQANQGSLSTQDGEIIEGARARGFEFNEEGKFFYRKNNPEETMTKKEMKASLKGETHVESDAKMAREIQSKDQRKAEKKNAAVDSDAALARELQDEEARNLGESPERKEGSFPERRAKWLKETEALLEETKPKREREEPERKEGSFPERRAKWLKETEALLEETKPKRERKEEPRRGVVGAQEFLLRRAEGMKAREEVIKNISERHQKRKETRQRRAPIPKPGEMPELPTEILLKAAREGFKYDQDTGTFYNPYGVTKSMDDFK